MGPPGAIDEYHAVLHHAAFGAATDVTLNHVPLYPPIRAAPAWHSIAVMMMAPSTMLWRMKKEAGIMNDNELPTGIADGVEGGRRVTHA
jgi:hypothetical protein